MHPALRAALPALVFSMIGHPAQAEDVVKETDLPFQRIAVGASVGGMGVAGASVSFGFDPYAMVELEAAARLLTGTQEIDNGWPDAKSGVMFSAGLLLAKHNFWDTLNPGVALRLGRSVAFDSSSGSGNPASIGDDLGEVYASVGPRLEGQISTDHKLTWFAELGAGVWLAPSRRPPTDLLALAWNGESGNTLDGLSQNFLLNLRLGVLFYPVR